MTNICLSSDGKKLSDQLSSSFERCPYFIIISSGGEQKTTSILNYTQTAPRGVEILIKQLLLDHQ